VPDHPPREGTSPRRPFGLRIVEAGEVLEGAAPPWMERAAKLARSGDRNHRALVFTGVTLARHGLRSCAPPASLVTVHAALEVAEGWVAERQDERAVRKARSDAFASIIAVERRTVEAVRASLAGLSRKQHTSIDAHADLVVLRFAGLAASFACGAALLALDAVDEPALAARVPQQVAGAIAYQSIGLGPARASPVRAAACEQAEWESERPGAAQAHGGDALALQLFHEYLGAAWKGRSDVERLFLDDFLEWSLGPLRDS
jgi:hypothetical protein